MVITAHQYSAVLALLCAFGIWLVCRLYKKQALDRPVTFFAVSCLIGVPCTSLLIFVDGAATANVDWGLAIMTPFILAGLLLIDFVPFGMLGLFLHALTRGARKPVAVLGCAEHTAHVPAEQIPGAAPRAKVPVYHRIFHVSIGFGMLLGMAAWGASQWTYPREDLRDHPYVSGSIQAMIGLGAAVAYGRR